MTGNDLGQEEIWAGCTYRWSIGAQAYCQQDFSVDARRPPPRPTFSDDVSMVRRLVRYWECNAEEIMWAARVEVSDPKKPWISAFRCPIVPVGLLESENMPKRPSQDPGAVSSGSLRGRFCGFWADVYERILATKMYQCSLEVPFCCIAWKVQRWTSGFEYALTVRLVIASKARVLPSRIAQTMSKFWHLFAVMISPAGLTISAWMMFSAPILCAASRGRWPLVVACPVSPVSCGS